MTKSVELRLYRHEPSETVIEGFEAKDWQDFLIIAVTIPPEAFDPGAYAQMSEVFTQFSEKMEKTVLLVPAGWDIEFYGVEVDGE